VTPPYFHDGSVAELPQAVRVMGKLQLGRDLGDADVADIVAFLESLTGEVPAQFAAVPSLPPGVTATEAGPSVVAPAPHDRRAGHAVEHVFHRRDRPSLGRAEIALASR